MICSSLLWWHVQGGDLKSRGSFVAPVKITKSILSKSAQVLHQSPCSNHLDQVQFSAIIANVTGSASNSLVQSISSLLFVATKAFEFESSIATILFSLRPFAMFSWYLANLHSLAK
ncbi:hypothetical protein Tco_0423597 [Tanacetum coccineum]